MKKTYFEDQFLSCENTDLFLSRDVYDRAHRHYQSYKSQSDLVGFLVVVALPAFVVLGGAFLFKSVISPAIVFGAAVAFVLHAITRCSVVSGSLFFFLIISGVGLSCTQAAASHWYSFPVGFILAILSMWPAIYIEDYIEYIIPINWFSTFRLGDFERSLDDAPKKMRDEIYQLLEEFPKAVDAIDQIDKQFRFITNLELKKLQLEFLGGDDSTVPVDAYQHKEATRLDKCKRCSAYKKCPIKPNGKLETLYHGK